MVEQLLLGNRVTLALLASPIFLRGTTMTRSACAILLVSLCAAVACGDRVAAVETHTEHTYRLLDGEAQPAASIEAAAWLAGSWHGTAFGERFEQTWNAPSGGTMVGLFKLFDGNQPRFYEILLLTVENDSLSLKVRHFNADFSAWEDKDEHVNFPLVSLMPNELHFSGLSFYRRNDDSIDGYLVMRTDEGIQEQHLKYERRAQ